MNSTIQQTEDFDTELEEQLYELRIHRRASTLKEEKILQAERSKQLDSRISQLHNATYRASLKDTLVSILEARPMPNESRLSESTAKWHNAEVDNVVQNFVNEKPTNELGVLQWPSKKEHWSIGVPLVSCDPDGFRLEITPIVKSFFDLNGKTRGQIEKQSVAVPWKPTPSACIDGRMKQILQAEGRTAAWWGTDSK